jgi:hypothetical protein
VRVADLKNRRIFPLAADGWTVEAVVEVGARYREGSYSLVSFDAPIGVPASYLGAARPLLGIGPTTSFLDWLPAALQQSTFLEPAVSPQQWSPSRPFFVVPHGTGGLTSFVTAAAAYGVTLKRAIETATRGNSVFAFNLPGQVAPAAQALWQELSPSTQAPDVAVWPFEGDLARLAERASVVVAEIYPRAAYGTALASQLPATPKSLAKTKRDVRVAAVAELESAKWVNDKGARIENAALAIEDDGDFDALLTAAALLRLTLAGRPLSTFATDAIAEGGILCA